MKIEFYIPNGQVIPIQLRLKVDDRYDVYYRRDPNEFAWYFTFWNEAKDHYERILDDIVAKMEQQSYDHGAAWRETERQLTQEPREWYEPIEVKVSFRVRDAG